MTGGLGPTEDDCTIDVLAKIFESEIVYNKTSYKKVESLIQKKS